MNDRFEFFYDSTDNPETDEGSEQQDRIRQALALEERIKEESLPPEGVSFELEEPEITKRTVLKRDIRKAAIARMEDAARTQSDFEEVVAAWDREDSNRERRERYHEIGRNETQVPLEWGMSQDEIIIPAPIHGVYWRQIMKGDFLDAIFDCPYELQELVTDSDLSQILDGLSEKHKALFYFLHIRGYSTSYIAKLYGQSDRNIRKVRATITGKIERKLIPLYAKAAA